jgi:tetratricopeptide (TPR) repeat protein
MGSFCLHKQEYEQAQEALETALARNPDDQVSRWNLATCYRAQGKEDLAKKEMDRILLPCEEAVRELQSRKDAPIHDWMMKRLHSQTESSEAIQPKSYPEFLLTYSRICYTLKRYEESKHLCEEVLKVEPENKIAYLFLGNTCGRMELQDEAASAYRIALSIDPALSEARFNLAGILLSEGNIDQAKDEYLRLLSADPDFLLAYSNLAQIYMQAQSYDEAAGAWREVLRLDPSNENASINLSILDFQKACEAVAENYRQVRQLLQRITQELSRTWGMIPPVFLELDRVLVLINRSSWLLTVISEIKTDILHVNNVRMEFEGILQAMEGMLPAFISIELTELARLMKTFESSLVKLRESIKVLPDNMSEMKIDLWNENGKN